MKVEINTTTSEEKEVQTNLNLRMFLLIKMIQKYFKKQKTSLY